MMASPKSRHRFCTRAPRYRIGWEMTVLRRGGIIKHL
jgi:hypothetical protein